MLHGFLLDSRKQRCVKDSEKLKVFDLIDLQKFIPHQMWIKR